MVTRKENTVLAGLDRLIASLRGGGLDEELKLPPSPPVSPAPLTTPRRETEPADA